MKVAIIKSALGNIGGLEKVSIELAKCFAEKACEVTVLTSKSKLAKEKLHFVSFKEARFFSYRKIRKFNQDCLKYLEEHPQDIVFGLDRNSFETHYRAGNGVHRAYLERRKKQASLLKRLSFSLNPLHRLILNYEKNCFEKASLKRLFVNSEMVKSEVLQYYHTDPDKIEVVYNGVDWLALGDKFNDWEERQAQFFEQSYRKEAYQFLFIGNGYARKGLYELLLALASFDNWELTVIGKDKETKRFIDLAKELNIDKHIHFLGQVKDVSPYYQLADCLAIPSHYDPFANVTIEALAMGLFVLSSKQNGGFEILSESSGSVIEELLSQDSFKKALEACFKHKKSSKSSKKIRNHYKMYSFSKQLGKIVDSSLCHI